MIRRVAIVFFVAILSACVNDSQPFKEFELLRTESDAQNLYQLVSSEDFSGRTWEQVEQQVMNWAQRKIGSFEGKASTTQKIITIHYRAYINHSESRGGIVISSGRTEGLVLYQELIFDLVRNGYSVYILDHRGQGFSSRLLDDDSSKGYVDYFENYVTDLMRFVTIIKRERQYSDKPLFLIAHSMGGAIASLYLEDPRGAKDFVAASFVTPMHEPWAAGGSDDSMHRAAQKFCDDFALNLRIQLPWISAEYLPGEAPFEKQYEAFQRLLKQEALADDVITNSIPRLERNWETRRLAKCDEHCGNPDAKVGGPTLRWLNQACAASRKSRGEEARRIAIPILLLQGQKDVVVNPIAQREFCDHVNVDNSNGGSCFGYVLNGAKHAVFIEEDSIRKPALSKILSFFDCVRNGQIRNCK